MAYLVYKDLKKGEKEGRGEAWGGGGEGNRGG